MKTRFTSDTSQVNALSGYMEGLSETVSTKRYISSAISFTESVLSEEFGLAMDRIAYLYPKSFKHVYEWGDDYEDESTVGNPAYRLWTLASIGRGSTRVLGFTFLPSRVPSPVHPELLEPGPRDDVVKEGIHIFTWKAPVIEYGLPVVIRPQLSKALAFYDKEEEEIVFSRSPIRVVPGSGGGRGKFTTFFIKWWQGGQAAKSFNKHVRPVLEKDLGDESVLNGLIRTRSRRNTMTVGIDQRAGYAEGKMAAKQKFGKASGKYIAQAAIRRRELYGD